MSAFLVSLRQSPPSRIKNPRPKALLAHCSNSLKVLELGSGCGIVGIAFAQLWPQCEVVLTDLAEAMHILGSNIDRATPASGTKLSRTILDWEAELPMDIRSTLFDVVLISDCTYNSDCIPNLVRTLSNLSDISPKLLVLIALKMRHVSERILFELLSTAGFDELGYTTHALPNPSGLPPNQVYDAVEIYEYQQAAKV